LESRAISLETEHDIVVARGEVRDMAVALGFRSIDQTRLATVASELARNIIKYAVRGQMIAQPTKATTGAPACVSSLKTKAPASPTSTPPCATASPPGAASAKDFPARAVSSMNSRSNPPPKAARA
jgi:hypothetical protein